MTSPSTTTRASAKHADAVGEFAVAGCPRRSGGQALNSSGVPIRGGCPDRSSKYYHGVYGEPQGRYCGGSGESGDAGKARGFAVGETTCPAPAERRGIGGISGIGSLRTINTSVRRGPTIRRTPPIERTCTLSASCQWSARNHRYREATCPVGYCATASAKLSTTRRPRASMAGEVVCISACANSRAVSRHSAVSVVQATLSGGARAVAAHSRVVAPGPQASSAT